MHHPNARSPTRSFDGASYLLVMLLSVTLSGLAANVVLTVGTSIKGFAAIPYVNLSTTFAAILVQAYYFRRLSGNLHGPLGFVYVLNFAFVILALIIGLLYENSLIHILAWTCYFLINVVSLLIQGSMNRYEVSERHFLNVLCIVSLLIVAGKLSTKFLDMSASVDNVMLLTMAVFFLAASVPLSYRLFGILLLVSSLVGFTSEGNFRLEGNRAGFLAIYVGLTVAALCRGKHLRLVPLALIPVVFYIAALSLDRSVVNGISSRNIREAILLIQGDDISHHVATLQRFYEVDKVLEDLDDQGDPSYIFGLGLGRTINMSSSLDESVQGASITGADKVNNIHFLLFALLHKFGVVGIMAHAFMWAMVARYLFHLSLHRMGRFPTFGFIYLFVCITYSSSASITYFSSPYIGILFSVVEFSFVRSRRAAPSPFRSMATSRFLARGQN
ncbi:hypothetical protein N2605_04795 [Bradyrhizobium yuanmingense]|uniref:hypothetical protein n=1 Tax=Bradyrhizobium TaxID=374 RepID=UPI001CD5A2AC|nr:MULTISPECIES: hypothetical protein [unclassified Bradyrhizobium]MCA1512323.1 hypothetical protein [Bradyrhizobium sp. NBAIM01]UWU85785.1 hypothetical protein N2605_04795 [Bradyrhizobium sp. CB1024]